MRDISQAMRAWKTPEAFLETYGRKLAKLANTETGAWGQANLAHKGRCDTHVSYELIIGSDAFEVYSFRPQSTGSKLIMQRLVGVLKLKRARSFLPQLVGALMADGILVSRVVNGKSLAEQLSEQTLLSTCRRLGAWHGGFSGVVPKRAASGTWDNYLTHAARHIAGAFDLHRPFLQSLPVAHEIIANTNVRIEHYIQTEQDQVVLAHPTAFRFMPREWGLLEVGAALAQKFPDAIPQIAQNLVEGWMSEVQTSNMFTDDIIKLIEIFCLAEPSPAYLGDGDLAASYLEEHNAKRGPNKSRAEIAFLSPHFDMKMTKVDEEDVVRLRERLIDIQSVPLDVSETEQADSSPKKKQRSQSAQSPSALLSALCASCSGFCCQHGLKDFAYFKHSDLNSLADLHPSLDHAGIADIILEHLPGKHANSGCLFQGARGCTLPRTLRSETCNEYLCGSAKRVVDRDASLIAQKVPVLLIAETDAKKKTSLWAIGTQASSNINHDAPHTE